MAGGPVFPHSVYPVTAGKVFPTFLTAEMPEGLAFMASLDADAIWRVFYRMPPTSLPTGTGKVLLPCRANATSGVARINIKWKSYAANEVPSAASLNAEGVGSVTFATTAYRETQHKVTLDADTLVAGEMVMMDITGETTSWTLSAVMSIDLPPIIWE